MRNKEVPTFLIVIIAIGVIGYFFIGNSSFDLPEGETVKVSDSKVKDTSSNKDTITGSSLFSSREIFETDGVLHTIDIEEIRQGCFGRDCIPSVDEPEFVSVEDADRLFRTAGESPTNVIGIAFSHDDVDRFYPFNMLVTREIVNDVVGGQPVAVTYCPLCGTGIVFNRVYDGEVLEFGVSGLLWQSNLLMYNRNENEEEISLWSQVLGESVLGKKTGNKLVVLPSDVILFSEWAQLFPKGEVLNTGRIGDPYNGNYYSVASSFNPSFNEEKSPINPTAYVFGIEIDGKYKAYENAKLSVGRTNDVFGGVTILIKKEESGIVRIYSSPSKEALPIVTGFWFSWVSAHPETEIF